MSRVIAEALAKRWMTGERQGPVIDGQAPRRAWEHPQDLVRFLDIELPCDDPKEQEDRACLAWLHDLLEDGIKEDGSRVLPHDLTLAGIEDYLVDDVIDLSQGPDETKLQYLCRLSTLSQRAKPVKCGDRICNLREGRTVFNNRRWIRYVGETCYFIYPLTESIVSLKERAYLRGELVRAVNARQLLPF